MGRTLINTLREDELDYFSEESCCILQKKDVMKLIFEFLGSNFIISLPKSFISQVIMDFIIHEKWQWTYKRLKTFMV